MEQVQGSSPSPVLTRITFFLYLLYGNIMYLVCQMMKEGVGVILGPQSPTTASHVQSVCEVLNVPHIETKWDFRSSQGNFLINLYPHPSTLSMVYLYAYAALYISSAFTFIIKYFLFSNYVLYI